MLIYLPSAIAGMIRLLLAIAMVGVLGAAQPRVAFLGDSITYDGRWAGWVEAALRDSPEFEDARIVNFGLSSETVSGLSEPGHAGGKFPRPCLDERLGRILESYKPTLVVACYGMNDGIFLPPDETRLRAYQEGIVNLKSEVEKAGARIIFVTPPPHDADHPSDAPDRYDAVLEGQAEWLVSQRADGWEVIDIRPDLRKDVAEEKGRDAKFVFSSDGVHPGELGHRLIAESIDRQLWPLLKLPGSPTYPALPAMAILKERCDLLKHAWLTRTRHTRPGVEVGLPLDQAEVLAAKLMQDYRAALPAKTSKWNGCERLDWTCAGRSALLVRPKQAAPGNPWIWRTEFFGHEPQADIALLAMGYHVAYIDVQNLYGAPIAIEAMDRFHDELTKSRKLADKVVLEGFSRGGLFAFNWAAQRPEQVAGIYVDAPVCDIKSWPGGRGAGPGAPRDWQNLLKVYGFTEEQALAYQKNPVDQLAPLAHAGIPIFAVIGAADETVPVSENIDVVEKRYLALGGKIQVIRKPGGKHHPHSLPDPAPIVEFVLNCYQ